MTQVSKWYFEVVKLSRTYPVKIGIVLGNFPELAFNVEVLLRGLYVYITREIRLKPYDDVMP